MKKYLKIGICCTMLVCANQANAQWDNDYPKDTVLRRSTNTETKPTRQVDTGWVAPKYPAAPATLKGGQIAAGVMLGIPQGEFAKVYDKLGLGLDFDLLYNPVSKGKVATNAMRQWIHPSFGMFFQYIRMGRESESTEADFAAYTATTEMSITNRSFGTGAIARVELFPISIRPFAEAYAGFRLYNSRYKIETTYTENVAFIGPRGPQPQDHSETDHLTGGILPTWGYGFGLVAGGSVLAMQLKVSNWFSGTVEYVDIESISLNTANKRYSYDIKKSRTDMLMISLALMARF